MGYMNAANNLILRASVAAKEVLVKFIFSLFRYHFTNL